MATRSTIAMKTDEGRIRSIYCHWDGYVGYNGKMLDGEYKTLDKVKQLIDLGDISSLRKDIGEKHPFDRNHDEPELDAMYEDWTTAYHRDRGEEWARVAPSSYDTVGEWVAEFDMGVEYFYLFDGQDWIVHRRDNMDEHGFPIFDFVTVEILKEIVN